MKKRNHLLPVFMVAFLAGCSTNDGGGGDGYYRGPDEWRDPLLAEIHRQDVYTGGAPGEAAQVSVNAYRCGSPSGTTQDGPYACDPACTRIPYAVCIHAWNISNPDSWATEFLFVAVPGDQPPHPILRHEIGHFILRNSPEAWAHATGHPDRATVRGQEYRVRDIISGARWPARIGNALTFGIFASDEWSGITCSRDGVRHITGTTPEEE